MRARKQVAGAALTLAVAAFSVRCDQDSGCAGAQAMIQGAMSNICQEPPYAGSSFCTVCVANHYFSTTGPSDCRCSTLAFDQESCAYPDDADVVQQVGAAISWANTACPTFTIGQADSGDASDAETADVADASFD